MKCRFLLVYGSQTGQSQVISEQIAEKAASKGFEVDLNCLDQSGVKVSDPIMLFYLSYKNKNVTTFVSIRLIVRSITCRDNAEKNHGFYCVSLAVSFGARAGRSDCVFIHG